MATTKLPTKINLGCGWDHREGYLNVDMHDFHKPDMVGDVSNLAELPSGHFEEAFAQDVLEHMPREVGRKAFTDWVRLVKRGGRIVVRVPSLTHMLQLFDRHPWTAESHDALIQLFYGTQAYNGDFHLAGFTAPIFTAWAAEEGLSIVSSAVIDTWMMEVVFQKTAPVELSNEDFVQHAFFLELGRSPEPDAVAHFAGALRSAKMTRTGLIEALRYERVS